MYGWRAKLGLILPANNTVAEPELGRAVPTGVSVHATKVLARGVTPQERVGVLAGSLPAARDALLDSRVHAMAYGCMMSCLVKGVDWEREACATLSTDGVPFGTAGGALVSALTALQARRITVFSPYLDQVAALIVPYFARLGFEVVANVNQASLADAHAVVGTHPEDLFRALARLPSADALCILATDLPTFQILDLLERSWGGPVISSNLALLSWLLRAAGVPDTLADLGLLGRLGPTSSGKSAPDQSTIAAIR